MPYNEQFNLIAGIGEHYCSAHNERFYWIRISISLEKYLMHMFSFSFLFFVCVCCFSHWILGVQQRRGRFITWSTRETVGQRWRFINLKRKKSLQNQQQTTQINKMWKIQKKKYISSNTRQYFIGRHLEKKTILRNLLIYSWIWIRVT